MMLYPHGRQLPWLVVAALFFCSLTNAYTNPYYNGGCLKNVLNENTTTSRLRVCNSQDPPEAAEQGHCRLSSSSLGYTEVRIGAGTWETALINDWLLQILLSELLDVPTSLEGGSINLNLYEPNGQFEFWNAYFDRYHEPLGEAARVGDCQLTEEPCYHVFPDVFWASTKNKSRVPEVHGVWDLGVISELAIFIPKFAAEMDPTLVSYIGLTGENNRRKLAETFKTPTRFGMYCQQFSPSNCTDAADPVAQRPPENEKEEMAFFVPGGVFNGFFRRTEESNCDLYNDTCAGDFINAPCSWGSYAKQQLYHNNIALEMRGSYQDGSYSYGEQFQIYDAAQATKSPIMVLAYTTDPPYSQYQHSDAEMTRVLFPPQSQECINARIDTSKRCDPNATFEELYGDPAGACDTYPQAIKKLVSNGLPAIASSDNSMPLASPAYDAIQNYMITELNYREIYTLWRQYAARDGTSPGGDQLREATCRWVVDNLELLQSFVPESHPRVIVEAVYSSQTQGLAQVALGLSVLAATLTLVSLGMVRYKRRTKAIYFTQIEWLQLVLLGMLLVSVGAVLLAAPVADETCVLIPWFVQLGLVLQLVPLHVRITAISDLATSGKQMQRVQLEPLWLYGQVGVGVLLLGGFALAWTIVDPLQEAHEFQMTDDVSEMGETIIKSYDYCGSDNQAWLLTSFVWQALVLVPSCLIALVARRVKEDLNDTREMSRVIFAHLFFLVLHALMYGIEYGDASESDLMRAASIILSLDVLLGSLVLYILPKLLDNEELEEDEEILPDVFVHTTICMIDVQGFTAWTSVREPVQVFQFLERLYEHFDQLAEKHQIFKVETTGETYVAATGIPTAQNNHCLLMASFAIDCMRKMPRFTKKQEIKFGPGTSTLTLRIGMHSGPVTGGFLKGKGSRFQVFGDTATVASLVHAHCAGNRIQLSQSSAELLQKAGKRKWIMEREGGVKTEEKGQMTTWWLVKGFRREYGITDRHSFHEGSVFGSENDEDDFALLMDDKERWVEFNVETFKVLLHEIIAQREAAESTSGLPTRKSVVRTLSGASSPEIDEIDMTADMPLEEVREVIELPRFDKRQARRQSGGLADLDNTKLEEEVVTQLRRYIRQIADRYNDNPFHNFAHASYVVMATVKYMNRIKAASEVDLDGMRDESAKLARHTHTYGITSDTLTQFACVFSALIHDADHPGVPNPQLIRENKEVAERYKERSVAEQKSLDIAWDLLQEEEYTELLMAICSTPKEMRRFRQLVVNSVMATDLGDKQLKELRNGRWDKAFAVDDFTDTTNPSSGFSTLEASTSGDIKETKETQINRKATIIIEHLIQAADVAHMSQHWSIYRQWNERLFREMYKAYRQGRAENNPADGWYKGEIGFFDFYIIPLSKKLRDCGVFGPTSDENLNYATNNRNRWVEEGEEIVKELLARAEEEYPQPESPPIVEP